MKRQILWFAVSFFALLVFLKIDYKVYLKHTKFLLIISFALLLLVFIPGLGYKAKGSHRWINFGFIGFQPSEFVRIFITIYLAKVFSSEHEGIKSHILQLLFPVIILAVFFILIMLQPNFSMAVNILIVSVSILFVSGFSIFYIASLFVISIPAFYMLVYQVGYRKIRMLAFLDPWQDKFGKGYHIIQSLTAFKKGGFFGLGLGYGTQKISKLPEPHNDFIFAVIAEEAGLIGTVAILLLYALFFWRGIQISMSSCDDFGRLLAIGLTMMIVIQAYINIGVVTGSLPTTGLNLPFISYGGSSLLSNMIAGGILLNISRYRDVLPSMKSTGL